MSAAIYGGIAWLEIERQRKDRERIQALVDLRKSEINLECRDCRKQPEDCTCKGGPR